MTGSLLRSAALTLLATALVAPLAWGQAASYSKGDVTGDGKVDAADVSFFSKQVKYDVPFAVLPSGTAGLARKSADVAPFVVLESPIDGQTYIEILAGSSGILDEKDLAAYAKVLYGSDDDLDRDGIPRSVEMQIGTSPFAFYSNYDVADHLQDLDGDGLRDVDEIALGLEPLDRDSDGDGVDDFYEERYASLDSHVPDAGGDADQDGLTVLQEFSLGTSPESPDTDGDGLCDGPTSTLAACMLGGEDADSDGVYDVGTETNPLLADTDADGQNDLDDDCPLDRFGDEDDDGICWTVDNCPTVHNPGQEDVLVPGNGRGDACDPCDDADGDGVCALADLCPDWPGDQSDANADTIGDLCQCGDVSGDGFVTIADIAVLAKEVLDPSQITEAYFTQYMTQPDAQSVVAAVAAEPPMDPADAQKCDVDGDLLCSEGDLISLSQAQGAGTMPAARCGDYSRIVRHVLDRTGYGDDDEARRRIVERAEVVPGGLPAALAEHVSLQIDWTDLHDPAGAASEAPFADPDEPLSTLGEDMYTLRQRYCNTQKCPERLGAHGHIRAALRDTKLLRSVYSSRQLESVLLDFWMNHFNVHTTPGIRIWAIQDYEREHLRPYMGGYFEDLLWSSMVGGAMLEYLDLKLSTGNDPNENFAREIMELHSIGHVETYDETDGNNEVREAMRVLTGFVYQYPYTYNENASNPATTARSITPAEFQTLYFEPRYMVYRHDATGPKTIDLAASGAGRWGPVTWTFGPDQASSTDCPSATGSRDLQAADPSAPHDLYLLENLLEGRDVFPRAARNEAELFVCLLARHPATAYLVSEKLVHRFVTEDTAPGSRGAALVDQMAATWAATDGHLGSVYATLLQDPAAAFVSAMHVGAKAKRPMHFVASLYRALGEGSEGDTSVVGTTRADVDELAALRMHSASNSFRGYAGELEAMGENLYLVPPPTGLPDTSDHWASAGGVVRRANWVDKVVVGFMTDAYTTALITQLGIDQLDPLSPTFGESAAPLLVAHYVPGGVSSNTGAQVAGLINDLPNESVETRVRQAVSVLLSSPEFARH